MPTIVQPAPSGNNFFTETVSQIPSGGSAVLDTGSSATGAAEIHTIATTGAFDLFKDVDTTGNGSFDVEVLVSSQGGSTHSQKNKIEVSDDAGLRLRAVNTSDSAIDIHITGVEVSA